MTVGEAIDRYIASKSRLLSPTTIREYKSERKKRLQGLMDIKLAHLTQEQVQRAINDDAAHCGIKTLRNVHGLLSAALSITIKTSSSPQTLPLKCHGRWRSLRMKIFKS